ncbi:hypothetical protein Lser_V15G33689 [Lactuca serriola]
MAPQQITEEAVYLCIGNPLPKDIEHISYWLLNESFSFSFQKISDIKARKGLALVDIVREVTMHPTVAKWVTRQAYIVQRVWVSLEN